MRAVVNACSVMMKTCEAMAPRGVENKGFHQRVSVLGGCTYDSVLAHIDPGLDSIHAYCFPVCVSEACLQSLVQDILCYNQISCEVVLTLHR